MMIRAKCIQKHKRYNLIDAYFVIDETGNSQWITSHELKDLIKSKQIDVINLKLTSDNKLIDIKDNSNNTEANIIRSLEEMETKCKILGIRDDNKIINILMHRFNSDIHIIIDPDFIIKYKNSILGKLAPLFILNNIFKIDWLEVSNGEVQYSKKLGGSEIKKYAKYSIFVTSMNNLFSYMSGEILTIDFLDTRNVRSMNFMFHNCNGTKRITFNNFDTSNVKTMECMFSECKKLEHIDISSFNICKITSTQQMFENCVELESIKLPNCDVQGLLNVAFMFSKCEQLKVMDINWLRSSNVSRLDNMFANCYNLERVITDKLVLSNAKSMQMMFLRCEHLKEISITFNTKDSIMLGHMFRECTNLRRLELKSLLPLIIKDSIGMVLDCNELNEVIIDNIEVNIYKKD